MNKTDLPTLEATQLLQHLKQKQDKTNTYEEVADAESGRSI
jgi:hypothetical protein